MKNSQGIFCEHFTIAHREIHPIKETFIKVVVATFGKLKYFNRLRDKEWRVILSEIPWAFLCLFSGIVITC